MSVELGDRRFGLFVELVKQRDVTVQRLLVAIERDGNAVDLRGDVVELLFKAAEASLNGGEQTSYEIGIL